MYLVTQSCNLEHHVVNYVHITKSDDNRIKAAIEYLCDTEEVVWSRPNPKVPRYAVEACYYDNRNNPYKVYTSVAVVPVTTLV